MEQRLSTLQLALKDSKGRHEELEFMFGLIVRLLEDIASIHFAKLQVLTSWIFMKRELSNLFWLSGFHAY